MRRFSVLFLLLATITRAACAAGHNGMKWIPAGEFTMGTDDKTVMSNEQPAVKTCVTGFWMDDHDITNAEFKKFVDATGYITTAERPIDWDQMKTQVPPGTPKPPDDMLKPGALVYADLGHKVDLADLSQWWTWTPGANWKHPEGPSSSIGGKDNYPVVQISWDDANAYAKWTSKRLPTEAEWEFAAWGGKSNTRYYWGNSLQQDGKFMCNTYTGEFPIKDTAADGFAGPSPVKSFPPNGYGLYDMAGNVWQWTSDAYHERFHAEIAAQLLTSKMSCCVNPTASAKPNATAERVVKGGSYLCNESYCESYRPSARRGVTPDTATEHTGFRCAMDDSHK